MTLGEHMRRYRSQNKMTCAQLAEKLGYCESHISYIENGWAEKCTYRKFVEIIMLLKLTPEEVYDIHKTYYDNEVLNDKCNC